MIRQAADELCSAPVRRPGVAGQVVISRVDLVRSSRLDRLHPNSAPEQPAVESGHLHTAEAITANSLPTDLCSDGWCANFVAARGRS